MWAVTVFDDKKLKRVVVATGQAAQDAFPTMLEAMGDINAAALEYKMTEQNCNSATHYFLSAAGLGHVAGPSKMTRRFGWSKKLQKKTNRPVPYPSATLARPTAPPAPATVPTTTWARTASRGVQKQTLLTTERRRVADPLGPFGAEPVEKSVSRSSVESSDEDQRAVSTLVEADDAFVLLTPLAMGAVEIDAGTRVEILKLSRSNDMAHIDYGRGRRGYVGLRDLEAAVGQRLG